MTPAGGRDYFVRIREGESPYERIDLCTFLGTNTFAVTNCSMELVGDHTWRVNYYMETNLAYAAESLGFWFRGFNKQTTGGASYAINTNDWFLKEAVNSFTNLPATSVANGTVYGHVPIDLLATHLVFEFNDETGAFSLAHGGYQDFNKWTDAQGDKYVGNFVTTSGVSDAKCSYTLANTKTSEDHDTFQDFKNWPLSMGTNSWWSENFGSGGTGGDLYPFDVHFDTMRTPNGWQASQGMFVSTVYTNKQDDLKGNTRALQMDGGGVGAIELSDLTEKNVPQGVDTFTFNARVAQQSSFNAFTYSFDYMTKQNYAFSSQVAMSVVKDGTDMSKATPSVSLVANYKPTKGCYEFRIRRLTATRMELSLWKWKQNSNGTGMVCERLTGGTSLANGSLPSSPTKNPLITYSDSTRPLGDYSSFSNYMVPSTAKDEDRYKKWTTCYISVYVEDGVAHVMGAMAKTANLDGATSYKDPNGASQSAEADSNMVFIYCTDSDSPLSKGTCGVGSTDCKAYFGQLQLHPVTAGTTVNRQAESATKVDTDDADAWASWDAASDNYNRSWTTIEGNSTEGQQWVSGIKSLIPTAELEMFTRVPGSDSKTGWTSRGVTNIASFAMTPLMFRPRLTDSCYVRLATAGDDEAGTCVVVDDLEVRQWRGEMDPFLGNDGSPDDWTYTEGWIVTNLVSKTVNLALLLQPKRGSGDYAMSLRSPWLKNGISLFSFAYKNADTNAALVVQIATNRIAGRVANITSGSGSLSAAEWTTLTNFTFAGMAETERASGTLSYSMSLRAPVSGIVRLAVDPAVIAAATNAALPDTYGQITITSALCYDEPALDDRAWWGWNLRTTGWSAGNANEFAYLTDWSDGLSAGLNWSGLAKDNGKDGVELKDAEKGQYAQHDPFIQSPPLESGIGNVRLRARKMYGATQSVDSVVCLQGATSKDAPDSAWDTLTNFVVSCPTYQNFSWKSTDDNIKYTCIRLSVPNVKEGRDQAAVVNPGQRVLIDEVSMFEPITPKLSFYNVAPFRSGLGETTVITNIMAMEQQPLLGESWGVQVALEPQQMGDDLDLDHVRVYFSYHVGVDKWGQTQWLPSTTEVELQRIGTNLVFRSVDKLAATLVPPQEGSSVVVQYSVVAKYWDKSQNIHIDSPHTHRITSSEWTMPTWYRGTKGDLNATYGANLSEKFSPYTILESISPQRAWINEINFYDGLSTASVNLGLTNQFIEVAAPAGADLSGWWLELIDSNKNACELATFGVDGVAKTKTANATNHYAFLTLCSPNTKNAKTLSGNQVDGTWRSSLTSQTSGGSLIWYNPYALRLVRPSGIWEHEIVFGATNRLEGEWYGYLYSPTSLCAKLNQADTSARWRMVGKDVGAGSLGVFRSHGENGIFPDNVSWQSVADYSWTNGLAYTPGRVNAGQDVDENYFLLPNGTNVWIYADVSGGHILEKFGTNLVESAVIVLPMEHSTNIVFVLDRWYDVATVTTNNVAIPNVTSVVRAGADVEVDGQTKHTKILDLKSVTSTLTVKAAAGADMSRPAIAGVKDSPYLPAILAWLQQFDDSKGIQLAQYWNLSGDIKQDLSLVDMYWLNINPVEGNWVFRAGMGGWGKGDGGSPAVEEIPVETAEGNMATNIRVTVTMMITNTASGNAYPPDCLQGLVPGSTSNDGAGNVYDPGTCANWTSATFKVTGALQYGSVTNRWVPLRWFVFGPDSFTSDFTATIDIRDPFQRDSPAASEGWGAHKGCPVFYRWAIDGRLRPDTTEMLKADSTFK